MYGAFGLLLLGTREHAEGSLGNSGGDLNWWLTKDVDDDTQLVVLKPRTAVFTFGYTKVLDRPVVLSDLHM